jgi:hypothetical protein
MKKRPSRFTHKLLKLCAPRQTFGYRRDPHQSQRIVLFFNFLATALLLSLSIEAINIDRARELMSFRHREHLYSLVKKLYSPF